MADVNFTSKVLTTGERPLTTGLFEYYVVPEGSKTLVKEILVCNASSGEADINIHFVDSGSAPSNSNVYLFEQPIEVNELFSASLNTLLEAGQAIHANVVTEPSGGNFNLRITGIDIS